VRNWPKAGLMLETHAIGLDPERTDEERLQLRKAGVNTSGVVVDGKRSGRVVEGPAHGGTRHTSSALRGEGPGWRDGVPRRSVQRRLEGRPVKHRGDLRSYAASERYNDFSTS
jgi:hypothetical protein